MNIKKELIERAIGMKLEYGVKVLGLDMASKSGWASLDIPCDGNITLEYGLINGSKYETFDRYKFINEEIKNLLLTNSPSDVIIEDTYLRYRNPNVFKVITRIGMIPFIVCTNMGIKKSFLPANTARKNIGLKPGTEKEDIIKFVNKELKLKVKDDNIADAIVLALNGVLAYAKTENKQGGSLEGNTQNVEQKSFNTSRSKRSKKDKSSKETTIS